MYFVCEAKLSLFFNDADGVAVGGCLGLVGVGHNSCGLRPEWDILVVGLGRLCGQIGLFVYFHGL